MLALTQARRVSQQIGVLTHETEVPAFDDFQKSFGLRIAQRAFVTAEDARYSLLRFMLTDRAGGPSALLLEPIAGVPATRNSSGTVTLDFAALEKAVRVEGRDLVITLPRPFGPFLSIMARWSYVLPKTWAVANGEWDGTEATWKAHNDPPKEKSFRFAAK